MAPVFIWLGELEVEDWAQHLLMRVNNFPWKMRIPDQIAIKSTLDRENIYLVNVWIVRYVVLGTSPWHGTCRSRAGQHGYPFSGYTRSVLDRRGTAR